MSIPVVNLVLDSMLPQSMRDPSRVLDKDGVEELMLRLAREHPDLYPKVAQFLSETGAGMAYSRGETFRLHDFKPPAARAGVFAALREEEEKLRAAGLSGKEAEKARLDLYGKYSDLLSEETSREALANRNSIAMTVLSGARGKRPQLRDMVSSPGFYTDADGRAVPWFVDRSFSEGVSPADFLASTYAGRGAVTEAKKAVAKGGFLAKTLARANYTNFITAEDCGTTNGLDLPADEKDLRGRVLQRPAAGFPAGTVITRDVYLKIRRAGKPVIARSPATCEQPVGVCSKCFGVTASGSFPKLGDHVGMTASNAEGEPMAQGALNSKHVTSGVSAGDEYSGLDVIYQFTESPEEFKSKTVVAPVDGVIENITPAPQGGSYITVGGEEVYSPPDRGIVGKVGDSVEAGDPLTDGLMDPEDVIRYKGLGAGRRYYAEKLAEISKASGAGMDRRNFEVLARTAVDHVRLDDPLEDGYLPDDMVSFNDYVHRRKLPDDIKTAPALDSVGRFLEQPALHFTPGTRITRSVAKRLEESGFNDVASSAKPPGFEPEMMRLQAAASFGDDWLGRLGSSYLSRNLEDSKTRALDTNIESNPHPIPRMAVGVGYGDKVDTEGRF